MTEQLLELMNQEILDLKAHHKNQLKEAIDRAYESASLAGGGISIEYNDTAKNRIKELYKEFGLI